MKKELERLTWLYVITWPILWLFITWIKIRKKRNNGQKIELYSRIWDGIPAVRQMREGAARWPALSSIYNWKPTEKGILGCLEWYYMNGRGCQALRNRYRCVVGILESEIERSIEIHGEARILSLAAGTCQSVFDAASSFGDKVKILAIDADQSALETSRSLAAQYGIKNVEWRLGNALNPEKVADGFNPTIVEVVGLIDYLSDTAIKGLLRRISKMLTDGGIVITAHIHDHQERLVIEELLDWEMKYRTRHELETIMSLGGFEDFVTATEPHEMFTVIYGRVEK